MAGRNDGWLTTHVYPRISIKLPVRYGKPESHAVNRHRRSSLPLSNFSYDVASRVISVDQYCVAIVVGLSLPLPLLWNNIDEVIPGGQ